MNSLQKKISQLVLNAEQIFHKLYMPSIWFKNAILNSSIPQFALFAISSVGLIVLFVIIISFFFKSVMQGLSRITTKHNYKLRNLNSTSVIKTLYIREAKRYFSSSLYVSNTIIAPIIGCIMSVVICVICIDKIDVSVPFGITPLIPFGVGAVFCMMTTTSVSISMEGKQF